MKLSEKRCVPCEGGVKPFSAAQANKLLKAIPKGWKVIDGKRIRKEFRFKDFAGTMSFVNKVALIAQEEGHHPDMEVHYAKCAIEFSTHSIHGLSENDFIMAAKIEQ
jgi:4a-hydroxytetrahydrobiopterin dehydratase